MLDQGFQISSWSFYLLDFFHFSSRGPLNLCPLITYSHHELILDLDQLGLCYLNFIFFTNDSFLILPLLSIQSLNTFLQKFIKRNSKLFYKLMRNVDTLKFTFIKSEEVLEVVQVSFFAGQLLNQYNFFDFLLWRGCLEWNSWERVILLIEFKLTINLVNDWSILNFIDPVLDRHLIRFL